MNNPQAIDREANGIAITHLCSSFELFETIIRSMAFMPSYCKETVDYAFNNTSGGAIQYIYAIPMVSFCDVSLAFIQSRSNYGKLGIGLSLDWAVKNKMNPVLYLEKSSHAATGIHRILQNLFDNENIPHKLESGLKWFVQYLKASKLKLFRKDGSIIDVDCYNEREWRFIPQILAQDLAKFPDIIWGDELEQKLSLLGNKPHFRQPEYHLSFEYSDLVFITVEDEKQAEAVKLILSSSNLTPNQIESIVQVV